MHEVSFQDKEKEHLTRLQDAEEMKVRAARPRSPARISTEFSGSRNTRLLQHWCGGAGVGRDPSRQSGPASERGQFRNGWDTEVS